MPGNTAVKSTARAALGGFWPKAVVCTLLGIAALFAALYANTVFYIVFGRFSTIVSTLFFIVFAFFFLCPLLLGILRFFWRSTAGSGDNIISVFYYLGDGALYLKSITFSASLLFRLLLVAAFSFLPLAAVKIIVGAPFGFITEQMGFYLQFLSNIFLLLGCVFFVIFSVRYYLAPALFIGCEQFERSETIYVSKLISRSTAGSYIVLIFGMLGWVLLSILGVTVIYTVPYIISAYVVHCRYAVNYYNHKMKILNETDFPEFRSDF